LSGFFVFSGPRLREIRERKHISREQVAVAADLSYQMILLCERGDRSPSRAALLRLAAALEVHPSELVEPDPEFEAVAP
jgi:transcriptional regulator with XRE-family HTH domain